MKKPATLSLPKRAMGSYTSAMARGGLRLTPQRRHVYEVLMDKRDHPTATEVFIRVQRRMPSISLATVYNCLETMVGIFTLAASSMYFGAFTLGCKR